MSDYIMFHIAQSIQCVPTWDMSLGICHPPFQTNKICRPHKLWRSQEKLCSPPFPNPLMLAYCMYKCWSCTYCMISQGMVSLWNYCIDNRRCNMCQEAEWFSFHNHRRVLCWCHQNNTRGQHQNMNIISDQRNLSLHLTPPHPPFYLRENL